MDPIEKWMLCGFIFLNPYYFPKNNVKFVGFGELGAMLASTYSMWEGAHPSFVEYLVNYKG